MCSVRYPRCWMEHPEVSRPSAGRDAKVLQTAGMALQAVLQRSAEERPGEARGRLRRGVFGASTCAVVGPVAASR
jgi:hypothetical protein